MAENNSISCLIVDDEEIAREIIKTHLDKINNIEVIACCKNAMEAFTYINKHKIDLLFLDINMPEISGITFAKSLNKNIKIIFTTAYRDYAIDGFELQALDYLLKPISFERILKSIHVYFDIYKPQQPTTNSLVAQNRFMFVRADRKMIKIDFDAIIYVESYSDYIKIHLEKETVVTRETITAIEAKLPQQKFIRIHRSFIISIAHIIAFTNEHVSIKNKAITISRTYKKAVLKRLEQF